MQSRDQTSNLLINCIGDEPHQQISPCIISTANETHVHIKLYKGKGHYTARPLFKTVLRFRITKLEKKHPTLQKYNRSSIAATHSSSNSSNICTHVQYRYGTDSRLDRNTTNDVRIVRKRLQFEECLVSQPKIGHNVTREFSNI